MNNIYLYVEKNRKEDCLKYGIKLSEYADKIIHLSGYPRKGIMAFLAPKDSPKFEDKDFVCLRVTINELNIFVYNKVCEDSEFFKDNNCKLSEYTIGNYEEPICLICSSILPENIYLYDKVLDLPILVENSKEFYYEKVVHDLINSEAFSNFELYKSLLELGAKSGILKEDRDDMGLSAYTDKKNIVRYIKRSE